MDDQSAQTFIGTDASDNLTARETKHLHIWPYYMEDPFVTCATAIQLPHPGRRKTLQSLNDSIRSRALLLSRSAYPASESEWKMNVRNSIAQALDTTSFTDCTVTFHDTYDLNDENDPVRKHMDLRLQSIDIAKRNAVEDRTICVSTGITQGRGPVFGIIFPESLDQFGKALCTKMMSLARYPNHSPAKTKIDRLLSEGGSEAQVHFEQRAEGATWDTLEGTGLLNDGFSVRMLKAEDTD
ncbi:hypothetical protein TREMEDRAFT_63279 [Tremella mesenterica DSM 1558]|uniref:uncharacterized protein n=1 Tax=Tremella mesenterica (strain ATCC 24925 / CBS 8224 / DSM 1558 / NBRC 9311 / NRRL Y-6157 / RJB 2259-6 / UBC 559-6) TaxID=578456 RepID=UPI0003F49370|nr:uncharacterized protein TREMEDRAFT_63279 [Tremella mesenterica DSM 1558]EIW68816.1 hypothetical protein TREMEDRAFT_63279 [Tremella mesenterica DSM 1558]